MTLTTETVHSLMQYLNTCETEENGVHEPILCRVVTRYDVDESMDDEPPLTVEEWRLACVHFEGDNPEVDDIADWVRNQRN